MGYPNAKVYNDGSHYIAIPQKENLKRKRYNPKSKVKELNDKTTNKKVAEPSDKEVFERLYKEYSKLPKNERKERIITEMKERFKSEENAEVFVENNMERVKRNRIVRLVRLLRKVYLQADWNYFATFTYDDNKQTEEAFKKKLSTCLKHLASRKQWKYIGVWERSPKNNRLHFHAILNVPENQMIGTLIEKQDYDTKGKRMQTTIQNTHFNERFGRSDFKYIVKQELPYIIGYLIKYIDKTHERLVYSRGLPTYFISDILDEDVACRIGIEDRKLLLFDNFTCFKEGEYLGSVCKEAISELNKCN